MVRQLSRIVLWEAHPVAGGEEKGGRIFDDQALQLLFRGSVSQDGRDLPRGIERRAAIRAQPD